MSEGEGDTPEREVEGSATGRETGERDPGAATAEVPVWEDEYLDRVSDRLLANFDLEKDYAVRGERFALYGEMRMTNQKHFFHPALAYAHQDSTEYLFARRVDRVTVADLERLVELGHDLADERVEADEDHYSTDVTFALVADAVPEDVSAFVEGFRDRRLIKYGYHGHYEVNLVVVAPTAERLVASETADVAAAFRLWEREEERRGLLGRLLG